MSDNITNLGMYAKDARMVSPEGCLRNCLSEDIGKRGAFKKGKKLIIICLNDSDDEYEISWSQAGMKVSEIISLLDVAKHEFIRRMDLVE